MAVKIMIGVAIGTERRAFKKKPRRTSRASGDKASISACIIASVSALAVRPMESGRHRSFTAQGEFIFENVIHSPVIHHDENNVRF